MTNTIDNTLASALFARASLSNNSQNSNVGLKVQPAPQSTSAPQIPSPSMQAGQLVSRVNRSSNLGVNFKREAIMMTALIDGVAPQGRQQAMLRALSGQIVRQEQASLAQGVTNAPALDDAQALFNQTREAVMLPRPNEERGDVVSLSPQARGRVLVEGFQDQQMVETVNNLGTAAVAEIFGEPPGVRDPENGRLPESARIGSPNEVRDERQALRESILRRITAGKFPE